MSEPKKATPLRAAKVDEHHPTHNRKQRRAQRALNAKRLDRLVQQDAPADANAMLISNRRGYAQAVVGAIQVEHLIIALRRLHGYELRKVQP